MEKPYEDLFAHVFHEGRLDAPYIPGIKKEPGKDRMDSLDGVVEKEIPIVMKDADKQYPLVKDDLEKEVSKQEIPRGMKTVDKILKGISYVIETLMYL